MVVRKKLLNTFLAISISSLPVFAHAGIYSPDLNIINNTDNFSTSIINNGACSTILGDIGISKPNSKSTIPGSKVRLACILNTSNCSADVYMTNNCTGNKIATVTFDVNQGVKLVKMDTTAYLITGVGFDVYLNKV